MSKEIPYLIILVSILFVALGFMSFLWLSSTVDYAFLRDQHVCLTEDAKELIDLILEKHKEDDNDYLTKKINILVMRIETLASWSKRHLY